ncbi:unnamed protein product [Anisakis simplex]|uniref:Uncharacterized protein n=1 Tax=Anisakis simplex TaxID=6269 RepID=A0A3P6P4I6_ANISI|nr:unnamed protein product [Anisakis simplex]
MISDRPLNQLLTVSMSHPNCKRPIAYRIIYEDNYCRLLRSCLVIKRYFFPTAKDKVITIDEIKRVFFKKQETPADLFKAKDWGMTASPIWWACDFARGFHGKDTNYYNVVIDTGTRIMKGFSVVSIGDFLSQLRPLVDNDKFVSDRLPSCADRVINKDTPQQSLIENGNGNQVNNVCNKRDMNANDSDSDGTVSNTDNESDDNNINVGSDKLNDSNNRTVDIKLEA